MSVTLFNSSADGPWSAVRQRTIAGAPLPPIARLSIIEGAPLPLGGGAWPLCGITLPTRYVTPEERQRLEHRQPTLGRLEATAAALIPIRKSAAWWSLPQHERREILEDRSAHIATGLRYLPAIARSLYHSRDLGGPFDFITWFEYAHADTGAFEELLGCLRASEEWRYVEREVDIRFQRLSRS